MEGYVHAYAVFGSALSSGTTVLDQSESEKALQAEYSHSQGDDLRRRHRVGTLTGWLGSTYQMAVAGTLITPYLCKMEGTNELKMASNR